MMRTSKYNYVIFTSQYSYWYNGLEHTFFRLESSLGKKVEQLLDTPEALRDMTKVFYENLVQKGFLIEDGKDEIEVIRKRNEAMVNSKDYFLIVLPTLNCNYRCPYCIQDHIPSTMRPDVKEKVKKHIAYMVKDEKITSLRLEWFGGEPFMYLNQTVNEIGLFAMNTCKEYGIPFSHSATTNGYFLDEKALPTLKELSLNTFQITFDGPRSIHNKVKFQKGCASTFDRVLQNIEGILSYIPEAKIILRINYVSETLDPKIVSEFNEIISENNRSRVTIMPKKVWQAIPDKHNFEKYITLLDLFEAAGYNTQRVPFVYNFVPCYVNQKYYNCINFSGDVVKCTACDVLYSPDVHGTIAPSGAIEWTDGYDQQYLKKGFENPKCIECKHLPICMGLCPRDTKDGKSFCKFETSDFDINQTIIDIIDYAYRRKEEKHG